MSSSASMILRTSNITTACLTSNSFTFTWIWKSRKWRWLRRHASTSRVFRASDLPPDFLSTTRAFPFDWAGVICPSSSLSSSTLMGEAALLLGLALSEGQTALLPVEPVSRGWEGRDRRPPPPLSSLLLRWASSAMPPLRQAALAAWPTCIGCKPCQSHMHIQPRLPPSAGLAGTFGADQSHCRRQDLALDGGRLGRYALLILFPNPLDAH